MTDLPAGWSTPDAVVAPGTPTTSYAERPAPVRRLLPLRPLATGEVLDGSVAVTRAFPRTVLAFGAVLAVVSALLDLVVTLAFLGPVAAGAGDIATDADAANELLGAGALSGGLSLLVSIVTGAVMAGVMTAVVGRAVLGEQTSLRQAWDQLRPRAMALLGLSLIVGGAVYGSAIAAVVVFVLLAMTGAAGALLGLLVLAAGGAGAVLLYVRWSLAPAALVLEGAGIRASLTRSSALVHRSFWRITGILLLALAIALTVSLVIQLPFQLLGYSPFEGFSSTYELTTRDAVLAAVSGALASTLVIPFSAGVRALLYVDRRMRAEGLDVALVAASR